MGSAELGEPQEIHKFTHLVKRVHGRQLVQTRQHAWAELIPSSPSLLLCPCTRYHASHHYYHPCPSSSFAPVWLLDLVCFNILFLLWTVWHQSLWRTLFLLLAEHSRAVYCDQRPELCLADSIGFVRAFYK